MPREMPIPAGVVGHDPDYRSINQYDPDARQQAARLLRLQEGQGRLPHAARRQAARDPATRPARRRIERELNELWKKSMDAIGIRMEFQIAQVRRPPQGGEGLPADDVGRGVDRRLSGRRQLHAAALRPEHRAEQQRLLRVEGVRRVLREVDADARFAGAQPPVPRDDAADGSRRRVEPARLARAQPADPAVGAGLQEAPDPAGRIHVHGHRAATADARIASCSSRHDVADDRTRAARVAARRARVAAGARRRAARAAPPT